MDSRRDAHQRQLQTRERILQATEAAMYEAGLSNLRMNDLAARLWMSKKTIYEHFPSKRSLVEAVIERLLHDVAGRLERIRHDQTLDAVQKIEATLAVARRQIARVGPRLIEDLSRFAPQLWRKIDATRQQLVLEHFREVLREGVEQGVVRNEINPELVTLLFVRCLLRIVEPGELLELPYSIDQVIDGLSSLMLRGLLAQPAVETPGR